MDKLKNMPLIIMVVMVVQFFIFAGSLFSPQLLINMDSILLSSSKASVEGQKIIATVFLFVMLCVSIYLSTSQILSYIYCGIVVGGMVIFGEMFFAYVIFVLTLPGMLLGGIVDICLGIVRFIFPGFSGVWLVWIAQMIGHCGVIAILVSPVGMLEELREGEKDKSSVPSQRGDAVERVIGGYVEGLEEIQKEQHEKEKLETLKDIDYHLKNIDRKK